jgi:hypothetical protein
MVPFAVCGAGVKSQGQQSYDEMVADQAKQVFAKGHELMRWFLA